jgi:hypothetical protein
MSKDVKSCYKVGKKLVKNLKVKKIVKQIVKKLSKSCQNLSNFSKVLKQLLYKVGKKLAKS